MSARSSNNNNGHPSKLWNPGLPSLPSASQNVDDNGNHQENGVSQQASISPTPPTSLPLNPAAAFAFMSTLQQQIQQQRQKGRPYTFPQTNATCLLNGHMQNVGHHNPNNPNSNWNLPNGPFKFKMPIFPPMPNSSPFPSSTSTQPIEPFTRPFPLPSSWICHSQPPLLPPHHHFSSNFGAIALMAAAAARQQQQMMATTAAAQLASPTLLGNGQAGKKGAKRPSIAELPSNSLSLSMESSSVSTCEFPSFPLGGDSLNGTTNGLRNEQPRDLAKDGGGGKAKKKSRKRPAAVTKAEDGLERKHWRGSSSFSSFVHHPLPLPMNNPIVEMVLGGDGPTAVNFNTCAICGASFRLTSELIQHARANHRQSSRYDREQQKTSIGEMQQREKMLMTRRNADDKDKDHPTEKEDEEHVDKTISMDEMERMGKEEKEDN